MEKKVIDETFESNAASFMGTCGSDLTVKILPRLKRIHLLLLFSVKYRQPKGHRKMKVS